METTEYFKWLLKYSDDFLKTIVKLTLSTSYFKNLLSCLTYMTYA